MQLPNREKLEADLAAHLARVAALKRRRAVDMILWLPQAQHFAGPPDSFYREVEHDARKTFDDELIVIFLAAAQFHAYQGLAAEGGDATTTPIGTRVVTLPGRLRVAAHEYAALRSQDAAKLFADSTQRAADALDKRVQELLRKAGENGLRVTDADIEKELATFAGPDAVADQAAAFALDETTAAQSAGGETGIAETVGLDIYDVWITRPDKSQTGPCKICQPLHRQPRYSWQERYPKGPGPWVHPNCVCEIEYANVREAVRNMRPAEPVGAA